MKELCNCDEVEACVSHGPWLDVGGRAEGHVLPASQQAAEDAVVTILFLPQCMEREDELRYSGLSADRISVRSFNYCNFAMLFDMG